MTNQVEVSQSQAVTCRGSKPSGEPCRSRIVLSDGFCNRHSPTMAVDGKAMTRRGGLKSGAARREQAKSVRARLRDKVEREFDLIAAAFDAGLRAEDERVRVSSAQALLSEAYGRPAVGVEVSGPNGGPVELAADYKPTTLQDVLTFARDQGLLEQLGMTEDVIEAEVEELPELST